MFKLASAAAMAVSASAFNYNDYFGGHFGSMGQMGGDMMGQMGGDMMGGDMMGGHGHAPAPGGNGGLPEPAAFTCNYLSRKQCDAMADKSCPEGYYFNEHACQCFASHQCSERRAGCTYGQVLDPRAECACAESAEVHALYTCEFSCEKTDDNCMNLATLNEQTCECECNAECEYGQVLNTDMCTCDAVDVQGDFTCDKEGMKVCTEEIECPEGFYQNSHSCDCFSKYQCRKHCGEGGMLDPREICECASIQEVHSLYVCPPCERDPSECAGNLELNDKSCECECNLECGYGEVLDAENCMCMSVDVQGDFDCTEAGHKQCTEDIVCPEGYYQNPYSCDCFSKYQCKHQCEYGQELDPREVCSCVDYATIMGLYTCDPAEQCELTEGDCEGNLELNAVKCQCECNLECGYGEVLNSETCTCDAVDVTGAFTCNAETHMKECTEQIECPEGYYQNPYSCDCFASYQCKKHCPYGETLDPREACECASHEDVYALYTCDPEACNLQEDQCEGNLELNADACECQCNLECPYGEILTEGCTCQAIDVEGDYDCLPNGYRQCTEVIECPPGYYQNPHSCSCFAEHQCYHAECGYDEALDPREECTCAAREDIHALFTCDPGCQLEASDCGASEGWSVSEDCQCQCDAVCDPATQDLNAHTCECIDKRPPAPPSHGYGPYKPAFEKPSFDYWTPEKSDFSHDPYTPEAPEAPEKEEHDPYRPEKPSIGDYWHKPSMDSMGMGMGSMGMDMMGMGMHGHGMQR